MFHVLKKKLVFLEIQIKALIPKLLRDLPTEGLYHLSVKLNLGGQLQDIAMKGLIL